MALELVGGALLSAALQVLVDRLSSRDLVAYLRGKCKSKHAYFDELLEEFKSELNLVSAVLGDAEKKQTTNRSIEVWVDMLQEVVFDAEDLLDEIETEADLQHKVEAESTTSSSKVRKSKRGKILNFFSRSPKSNWKDGDLESKIKKILERLGYLARQVPVLNLVKGTVLERPTWRPLPSTSLVDEFGVYGRDDDKKAIMKLLLSDDASNEKVSVIPMVGMGGIGKTTIAQAVFNDDQVEKHFELKAWVFVSDDFDACRVIKALLQSLSSPSSCDAIKELNLLQVKLKEKLSGKKFLIVLDDVWNENYEDWDNLRKPFIYGAQGSKIMVTTRSKEVASNMRTGTVPTYHLKLLEEEACWQVFSKHAFGDDGFNAVPSLERIGRDIVKKCKGLPLAIKTLAGLLRSTQDVTKWEGISSNEIWELPDDRSNILPALSLSYHYLPSHLKRCFAYCSIFPKDFQFKKENLVLLWMAEDLLVHPKRDKKFEDVGNEYFDDLLCRSFFQRSGANESLFVMHDLMNDLAKFVSKKYCFRLENGNSDKVEKNTRRVACVMGREGHDLCESFKSSIEATRLRTFLQLGHANSVCSLFEVVLKSRLLRALSFSIFWMPMELPDSIGELRHLRYLDLSGTPIKRVPESICMLYNLQTLKLKGCMELTKLPGDFHRLVNLRYLDVEECFRLKEMPKQMGKLKKLQRLSTFIVGEDNDTNIGQLGELSDLKGRLHLKSLKNVSSARDASEAKLKDKCLEKLVLDWRGETGFSNVHESGRDILDNLMPSIAVKELEITGYGDRRFPNWLGDRQFCNIVDINLSDCKFCDSLPPLGQLPFLRCLEIGDFDGVVRVGREFYGITNSRSSFVSLEVLKFGRMPKWEEWSIPFDNAETFRKLKELSIWSCEKLTGDLPSFLPSLKQLEICSCPQLASAVPMMPEVNKLSLIECNRLIGGYDVIEKLGCLEDLTISKSLDSTTRSRSLPATLKRLRLSYCENLEIPLLQSYDFPHLTGLEIDDCKNLITTSSGIMSWDPQRHPNLTTFRIFGCDSVESFPEEGLLPTTITNLEIHCLEKLKTLDGKGLQQLTSLKSLLIFGCKELQSITEEGLPSSLEELHIWGCPLLEAKCEKEKGEYWNKISHIPKIYRHLFGKLLQAGKA